MRLGALYSNDPARFPPIRFHAGLNVIFAKVQDATLKSDAHNLGKTFLIRVLDFALLGGVNKNHPFRKREDLFGEFVFYLEVVTAAGPVVTVSRPVTGARSIRIDVADGEGRDLVELPESEWTHTGLGVDAATVRLNRLIGLGGVEPYNYRKGLGYFLRRQADYNNEFMISRFGRGKDRDWKPFMTLLLGLDHELAARKYDADRQIEARTDFVKELERTSGARSEEFDELRAMAEIKELEVDRRRGQVNAFDFAEVESDISRQTVREIETTIADLNQRRYELERQTAEIERSLATQLAFDLDAIRATFEEVGVLLPDALTRQYEELVEFNQQISTGRRDRLQERQGEIAAAEVSIESRLGQLNARRRAALEILGQRETLEKFKEYQRDLLGEEEALRTLREKLAEADRAGQIRAEIRRLKEELADLAERIREMVRRSSDLYRLIRQQFGAIAQALISHAAVLFTDVNDHGNLEFKTRVMDLKHGATETEEGEGTSYKKLLCASFDLALLRAHAEEDFYRFVYHDGVFEGLDNRRKVTLLDTVQAAYNEHRLQYILTVIDTDLPRNDEDQKLLFSEDQIVRELHDGGDSGRLFRMPAF